MKPIGRIIWEAADRSEHYPLIWDQTFSIALLPGGACTVRQGGNSYAFQGITTPVAYAEAPVVAMFDPRPALDTLAAAIHALPVPADYSAALAAIQLAVAALISKTPADAAPAIADLTGAVNKLTSAAAAGPTTIALPNGSAGGVWTPFNTADPDPTVTIGAKPAVVTPLTTVGTVFAP